MPETWEQQKARLERMGVSADPDCECSYHRDRAAIKEALARIAELEKYAADVAAILDKPR